MYNHNSDQKPMSPRISFSNDFAESAQYSRQQLNKQPSPPPVPVSVPSDFEFSVSNYSMISADELFCKGRLLPLPFKNNCPPGPGGGHMKTSTIRDELLAGEDDDAISSSRPPKASSSGSTRWKGFLGLRKSHIGSKKSDGSLERTKTTTTQSQSQEMMDEGGSSSSSCRDVEFRMH